MGLFGHSIAVLTAILALPVIGVGLSFSPRWRRGILERFGFWGRLRPGAVWIHGASVGEIRSGLELVKELERLGVRCVATTSTTTGRDLAREEHPSMPCHLIPFDHPWSVTKVFRGAQPRALVLLEKELWPIHIKTASNLGIPVFLLSARMSERSAVRNGKARFFFNRVLSSLSAIGARSDKEAERFVRLGASRDKVFVTGDLKLQNFKEVPECAFDLKKALANRTVWVAASTHRKEEQFVAVIQDRLKKEMGEDCPALVIAPRHPERFGEAFEQSSLPGLSVIRRSDLGARSLSPGEVLLLDTIGELQGIFSVSSLVFVGGSLVERGGHNPLEAIQLGVKVLIGPHLRNVEHLVEEFEHEEVLEVVSDERELEASVLSFFQGETATNSNRNLVKGGSIGRFRNASENAQWLFDRMQK